MANSAADQESNTSASKSLDALLCFDANLPKLDSCKPNCSSRASILCPHRFKPNVQIEFCNSKKFSGWSDLRIFTHFLGYILDNVAKQSAAPGRCIFIILTKDRNFIEDIKKEWRKTDYGKYFNLVFSGNSISWNGIVVFVQQVDCPNYGNKRTDDLKCIFFKINNFLRRTEEA